ncbi:MAG: bifunctional nuclease domain-containing protein [bacterium]
MIPVKVHSVATDENQDCYYAVLTGEGEQEGQWLPLRIGASEAVSIATELNEQEVDRPGSHDLIHRTLETLGASVDQILMDRSEESVTATLFIESGDGRDQQIEARPSDALAIGIRSGADLIVTEGLMDEASRRSDFFGGESEKPGASSEVTKLRYEMEQAIEEENYERAAELKQLIKSAVRKEEESMELEDGLIDELRDAYRGPEGSNTDSRTQNN